MDGAFEILEKLRTAGWTIAVHNDYRLHGKQHTFYLFTHNLGVWAKGEGETDLAALGEALEQAKTRQAGFIPNERLEDIRGVLERGEDALGPTHIYPWGPDVRLLFDAYLKLTGVNIGRCKVSGETPRG